LTGSNEPPAPALAPPTPAPQQCTVGDNADSSTINCLNDGKAVLAVACACECPLGFRGDATCAAESCTVGNNAADPSEINCLNSGTAFGTAGDCGCKCEGYRRRGYEGDYCEIKTPCLGSYCLNGGVVSGIIVDNDCTCDCSGTGFCGTRCSENCTPLPPDADLL
jgi:hypothetical protein